MFYFCLTSINRQNKYCNMPEDFVGNIYVGDLMFDHFTIFLQQFDYYFKISTKYIFLRQHICCLVRADQTHFLFK